MLFHIVSQIACDEKLIHISISRQTPGPNCLFDMSATSKHEFQYPDMFVT